MKEPICDLAHEQAVHDDPWRRHATGCPDCRELLAVSEWMTTLGGSTAIPRGLPAAGYLLVKARIQARQSAAARAVLPTHAMIVIAGILFVATVSWLLVGGETRFGSIMIDAIRLLASNAGVMVLGAAIVAVVCAVAAYIGNLKKASGSPFEK